MPAGCSKRRRGHERISLCMKLAFPGNLCIRQACLELILKTYLVKFNTTSRLRCCGIASV